jgi:hypothetical protein
MVMKIGWGAKEGGEESVGKRERAVEREEAAIKGGSVEIGSALRHQAVEAAKIRFCRSMYQRRRASAIVQLHSANPN